MSAEDDASDFVFKTNKGLFEITCKTFDCSLKKERVLLAYVGDAKVEGSIPSIVRLDHNGIQQALLTVASDDGGFHVIASAASTIGPRLKAGDLVLWMPLEFLQQIADASTTNDERFGWIGLISATVEPVYNYKKGWKIKERFVSE